MGLYHIHRVLDGFNISIFVWVWLSHRSQLLTLWNYCTGACFVLQGRPCGGSTCRNIWSSRGNRCKHFLIKFKHYTFKRELIRLHAHGLFYQSSVNKIAVSLCANAPLACKKILEAFAGPLTDHFRPVSFHLSNCQVILLKGLSG
jgi:hypothetical protein